MILTLFDSTDYLNKNVANIFNNPRFYLNIIKNEFVFASFSIDGNMRPEQAAYDLYGDSQLYWVLLLLNDIIDPYHEWIKSMAATQEDSIYRYSFVGGPEQVDHYVDETGRIWYNIIEEPEGSGNWYSTDKFGNPDRFVHRGTVTPVSVTEYEQDQNENKRVITVVNPGDIKSFVDRMVDVVGEFNVTN